MKAANYRTDHYARQAARDGYRARSVYKLRELDQRYKLLRGGQVILDIGAAPGSWAQYCAERVGKSGRVVGVDLKPFPAPAPQVEVVCGDICDEGVRRRVAALGADGGGSGRVFDGVLSDVAPATTGIRLVDSERSAELVETVIEYQAHVLKPGAFTVIKLLASPALPGLVDTLERIYRSVLVRKPAASRAASSEVYLLGRGFVG